jgi:alanine-glyoxylate transaminase/serine-glyoxylate transaminase/serine-pyruvate transaminase
VSPETLVVLDGVCSVASEEIKMDEWGVDVVLTASQKGLGTPPGLSILVASEKAMKASESVSIRTLITTNLLIQVFETRKVPPASYYASWKKWLPIMKAYESGSAAYFATPPGEYRPPLPDSCLLRTVNSEPRLCFPRIIVIHYEGP